ncbi:uncharacterized protein MONBRDRAFT_34373 [Monosiga brevicollis MX1]|uniref:Cation/H+ exchanger transmembrane domain-containing protein n=1 Tax=Monosiga brevicollis TaxID=81824 RepID=A9VB84_MONBE|nr:uncharacterized protein MONBRDRAFT_34373 [Monosiga brevicollis MX1]EDQ85143.1 predicted protein [Monosiga brevicollis MX1]|eukprot:XP_001749968.1 hypothetical protein [Monosiga brevicollis MX1]
MRLGLLALLVVLVARVSAAAEPVDEAQQQLPLGLSQLTFTPQQAQDQPLPQYQADLAAEKQAQKLVDAFVSNADHSNGPAGNKESEAAAVPIPEVVAPGRAAGGTANEANAQDAVEIDPSEKDEKPLLADALKDEQPDEEAAAFADRRVNFRSKRLIEAFATKRSEPDVAPTTSPVPRVLTSQVLATIMDHVAVIRNMTDLTVAEKQVRIEALNMTMRHINTTYNSYVKTTNELQSVLDSDFSSFQMREHAALERLEENQEQMEALEEARNHDRVQLDKVSLMLNEVEDTAKTLQRFLDDHAFRKAQNVKDASLITVIKIQRQSKELARHDDQPASPDSARGRQRKQEQQEMTWLVDADNNQFALTRPSDTTELLEDVGLLNDLLRLVIACFLAGAICTSFNMPSFVGYVVAGTLLGPSGLNVVTTIVQITTIGDLGVFFVLFTLGMEFSISKLRDMFRVAVVGGTIYTIVSLLGITLFVAMVVALSSTTVAANNLTHSEHESTHGRHMLGMLLMQDVYLGVIVAASPLLASLDNVATGDVILLILWLIGSFVLLGLITALFTKFVVEKLVSQMSRYDETTQLLAILSICFGMLKLTEHMEVSMELGCFLAGLMFSMADATSARLNTGFHAGNHGITHRLMTLVDPVKDLFLAIFFASVGMHIYPTFLATNATLLLALTTGITVIKYTAGIVVLKYGVGKTNLSEVHVMSVGLAQISEFAFVLASRGRRLGILSQPIYFLLLSVTGLSLLLAPLIWSLIQQSRQRLLVGPALTA